MSKTSDDDNCVQNIIDSSVYDNITCDNITDNSVYDNITCDDSIDSSVSAVFIDLCFSLFLIVVGGCRRLRGMVNVR